MDAVAVHLFPDSAGNFHIIDTRLNKDVYRGNNGRFGELPDVELVYRSDTWDSLNRVSHSVERYVRWDGLHEDVRSGFD